MKYIFFGTPEFAAIILKKLISAGMPPAAVVCNPDRPAGRKKILTSPPAKILALKHGISVLQPESLEIRNWELEIEKIKNRGFDFFLVAAYAKILPKEIINIPRLGTIGVHPSLLPKYRGATPIQSAILNGETETGVTLFLIDEKVDHGKIIANRIAHSANQNYKELEKELAELAGDLLIETLQKYLAREIKSQVQNENGATYTKKFTTEDGYVDLAALQIALKGEPRSFGREKAIEIDRKIKALNPEPGVYTIKNGKRIKLLEAEFKNDLLTIKKIQVEGKKPTPSLTPLQF